MFDLRNTTALNFENSGESPHRLSQNKDCLFKTVNSDEYVAVTRMFSDDEILTEADDEAGR